MFESLTNSFKSAINKIRFKDDDKALKNAIEELKKSLLKADVHYKVTKELLSSVEILTKQNGIGKESFLGALEESLNKILTAPGTYGFVFAPKPPTVVLMMGLQGSGKTTTTGKLANYLKLKNKKVLLAACDLQRLAAVEQLKQVGASVETEVFALEGKKPLDVAKEALKRANDGLFDVLIIDSAGRLAIDEELMGELKEIKSALNPHECFYVVDSLSGQDGVRSAERFKDEIGITGVILTKYDGDSKGGIALSVAHQLEVPLRFIGTGEKLVDFEQFLPDRITSRLMGAGDIASLAEKTASVISEEDAKKLNKKMKKGEFSFNDFLEQIENVKKIGSMKSIVSMIPGLGGIGDALKDIDLENSKEMKHIRAMIMSMTPKERENPDLLNNSRKRRVALGAGLEGVQVNRFIKQFANAQKMAKKFSGKNGMQDLMNMMNQNKHHSMGKF